MRPLRRCVRHHQKEQQPATRIPLPDPPFYVGPFFCAVSIHYPDAIRSTGNPNNGRLRKMAKVAFPVSVYHIREATPLLIDTQGEEKMTEFQMATLEISRAGLEISHIGLWISAVHALITLVVGGVQCFLIIYGLKQMNRASVARDKQNEINMKALETLIERTSK